MVETVGLRITTVRDGRGVLWYVRNGEIVRVGNKSQGWAMVVIDLPIGFVNSEQAIAVLRAAAQQVADDPAHATEFIEPPDVIGVETLTVDGATIRTIAKTTADGQVAGEPGAAPRADRGAGELRASPSGSPRRGLLPRPAVPYSTGNRLFRTWPERPDLCGHRFGGCRI